MSKDYIITSSPHIRDNASTDKIMRNVVIALLPALIASLVIFKLGALSVILTSVISCVAFEFLYAKLMKKQDTVGDLSAVVTGILLAFCLPAGFPVWMTIMGAFIAIVIVKQLFGGLGSNFANPAIVARIVLMLSFPSAMTNFPPALDAVAGATPLMGGEAPSYLNMFLGNMSGSLGEVSKLLLLIGGIYLVARQIITVTIPLSYMATVVVIALITGNNPVYHLLTGGIILGAIFMATDYVTSPTTEKGKLIYGIGCGLITMLIRISGAPEGVSYAILLMNVLTPLIDSVTQTKPLGGVANE